MNFLTNFAFEMLSVWWVSELLPDWFLYHFWARWGTKLFSDGLLDSTLWWIMLKPVFSVLIYWLVDLLIDLWRDSNLFLLWFFSFYLFKTWYFLPIIFVKKLFQFVFCLTYFSLILCLDRFSRFFNNINKRDSISYLLTLFYNGRKYCIFIINKKLI